MAAPKVEIESSDVEIRTPDGVCDAAFIRPKSRSHPGVLIWPDAGGLRLSMREMGARLAAEGYAVLVPNPYYRHARPPVIDLAHFSFQNPDDMAKIRPLMASATQPDHARTDAIAFIGFLDAQREVDQARKIGVQGYCMGGPLALRTAAAVPHRVGAGASFHGGGLVTDKPESPHRLAPQIQARLYFGVASDDDAKQPDAKVKLREAFPQAEIEVYGSQHGWCVPDMPPKNGEPVYNEPEAEYAWNKLVTLYGAAL